MFFAGIIIAFVSMNISLIIIVKVCAIAVVVVERGTNGKSIATLHGVVRTVVVVVVFVIVVVKVDVVFMTIAVT